MFGPMIHTLGIHDELSFIDSNVALPWVVAVCLARCSRPDLDCIIAGLWLQTPSCQAFKWIERVSSHSNLADRHSWGLEPECPREWRLVELRRVPRWDPALDGVGRGRTVPQSPALAWPN